MHKAAHAISPFLILLAASSAANAADLRMPVKAPVEPRMAPPFSWTGFYVGANGGAGWNQPTASAGCTNAMGTALGCANLSSLNNVLKPAGGLFGGQIGYDWQNGILVYGFETDIQWSDIKDDVSGGGFTCFIGLTCPGGSTPFNFSASQKLEWFGTVRGRVGITPWSQNALIYVTGGLIYGEEKVSSSVVLSALVPPETFAASASSTRTGGTIGGGLEYRFTPALSGKIEGLWYDMGSLTTTGLSANGFIGSTTYHVEGGIIRAGLNYHFW